MLRLFLIILFVSSAALAASNDAMCIDVCSKCESEQTDVCSEFVKICQCDISSGAENQSDATADGDSEFTQEASSAPIMKATFGSSQEKPPKSDGAIINVNFGHKGDREYTAQLQKDGSYEMKDRDNTAMWVAIGGTSLLVLVFIIALAL